MEGALLQRALTRSEGSWQQGWWTVAHALLEAAHGCVLVSHISQIWLESISAEYLCIRGALCRSRWWLREVLEDGTLEVLNLPLRRNLRWSSLLFSSFYLFEQIFSIQEYPLPILMKLMDKALEFPSSVSSALFKDSSRHTLDLLFDFLEWLVIIILDLLSLVLDVLELKDLPRDPAQRHSFELTQQSMAKGLAHRNIKATCLIALVRLLYFDCTIRYITI